VAGKVIRVTGKVIEVYILLPPGRLLLFLKYAVPLGRGNR